jgi:hypothetical protein
MQFYGDPYKHPYHIPVDQLKADMEKLLDAVDYVHTMTVLGGGTFPASGLGGITGLSKGLR